VAINFPRNGILIMGKELGFDLGSSVFELGLGCCRLAGEDSVPSAVANGHYRTHCEQMVGPFATANGTEWCLNTEDPRPKTKAKTLHFFQVDCAAKRGYRDHRVAGAVSGAYPPQ